MTAPHLHLPRLLAIAALALVASATPAAADAAGPTDYTSEVTGIEPAVDGVQAEVRGGDSFIELTVEPGTEVVVYDYTPESPKPYLRFLADGTVERNRWSPATYVNDDRKGKGEIPPEANDPDQEPEWEEVASGGTYAWHDHRMHWMQDSSPRGIARGDRVTGAYDPWRIPIEVDGTAATVEGTLTYEESASPLPWVVVAVVVLGAVVVIGRRAQVPVAAAALAISSGAALVVGRAEFAATPDTGGNPLLWILPAVACGAALAALALRRRPTAVVLALAAVAALSGWAVLRLQVLTKPVLPTDLPFAFDRATTAAALAVAVGAAYLAVVSGALKLPELEDDPA